MSEQSDRVELAQRVILQIDSLLGDLQRLDGAWNPHERGAREEWARIPHAMAIARMRAHLDVAERSLTAVRVSLTIGLDVPEPPIHEPTGAKQDPAAGEDDDPGFN